MNIPIVLRTLSSLFLMFASILFVPLGVAAFYRDDTCIWAFACTILISGGLGGLIKLLTKKSAEVVSIRESIAIVTFSWFVCISLGAIPLWYSGFCSTYCDAIFEATSGFTTTGASIFTEVEILPRSILFWRAFMNWLGGMGIIVIFVALMPALGVSGYQLFTAEVAGPTHDKLKPRIGETAKLLWIIYLIFTASLIILLYCGGMPPFDAICHSFATVSTGGFSTKNTSIAHYDNLFLEIIIMVFMFICGCNFALYYKCFQKDFKKVLRNSELRFFGGLILIVIVFLTLTLYFSPPEFFNSKIKNEHYSSLGSSLRHAAFQAVTICSGTGHVTTDFDVWPNVCRFLLVLLMFIGACAGSTGGGIKCVRILLLLKSSMREFLRIFRPRMVKHVKINGISVSEEIIMDSSVFFVIYLGFFGICSLILMALNTDMITSFSAVATCMANCGPGLAMVGPAANYSEINYAGKWVLSLCMLLGRLEIYSFVLLFLPITWKR